MAQLSPIGRMYYERAKWARGVLGEAEWERLGKVGRRWDWTYRLTLWPRIILLIAPFVLLGNLGAHKPVLHGVSLLGAALSLVGGVGWYVLRREYRRARAEIERFAPDDPKRLAALVAVGDDLAERIRGPMTPEEHAREADHTVEVVDESFVRPAREQLTDGEWRQLVRWRDLHERFHAVRNISLLTILVGLLPLACVAYFSRPGPVRIALHPALLLIPLVPAVSWLGMWLIERALKRDLQKLAEAGRDAAAIAEGLWEHLEAQRVAQDSPKWMAAAREENRPWTAWLQTELSGLHLLLWLALGVILTHHRWESLAPEWTAPLMVLFGFLWVAKVCYCILLLCARGKGPLLYYYRWAGTWWGTLISLILVPAGLFAFGAICVAILELFGF